MSQDSDTQKIKQAAYNAIMENPLTRALFLAAKNGATDEDIKSLLSSTPQADIDNAVRSISNAMDIGHGLEKVLGRNIHEDQKPAPSPTPPPTPTAAPRKKEEAHEIREFRIYGGMGTGKSTILVGLTFECCVSYKVDVLLTNMKITELPKELKDMQIFHSGDIRLILEKMASFEGTDKTCALMLDELDKGIAASKSQSTNNLFLTSVAKDARKYHCKAFLYSSIPRKGVDSRIRASDWLIVHPRHMLNKDKSPMFYGWRDPEAFEKDFQRGEDNYKYAFQAATVYSLSFLKECFDTLGRIPIDFDGLLSAEEVPVYTMKFLEWCRTSEINLHGMSHSTAMKFMRRWNNEAKFVIPLSPKNLEIVLTELIRRGEFSQ